jgi:hypothetical protein
MMMAWKNLARLSGKQVKSMFKKWRSPPPPDLPPGGIVPKSVMRTLQNESLSGDPVAFNARLQELLNAYKSNGG